MKSRTETKLPAFGFFFIFCQATYWGGCEIFAFFFIGLTEGLTEKIDVRDNTPYVLIFSLCRLLVNDNLRYRREAG